MGGFIPERFVVAFAVGGVGVEGDAFFAAAPIAVVFVYAEVDDARIERGAEEEVDGDGVPDAAFGCGDVLVVEPFADGFEGCAVEIPLGDLFEGAGFGRVLDEGVVFVAGVDAFVCVGCAAEACVEPAFDAPGHFLLEVAAEGVGFVAADDVAEVDDHADCGFVFFGVLAGGYGVAGVGVDVELDAVVAEDVEDLTHEGAEAVEVVDVEEVEFFSGCGFEEGVEGLDLFFGVVEGDVFGAGFAGGDVFSGGGVVSGCDEFASFRDLDLDADLVGGGLADGGDGCPDGGFHGVGGW